MKVEDEEMKNPLDEEKFKGDTSYLQLDENLLSDF